MTKPQPQTITIPTTIAEDVIDALRKAADALALKEAIYYHDNPTSGAEALHRGRDRPSHYPVRQPRLRAKNLKRIADLMNASALLDKRGSAEFDVESANRKIRAHLDRLEHFQRLWEEAKRIEIDFPDAQDVAERRYYAYRGSGV